MSRLVVLCGVAGGVVLGGFGVAALTLTGSLSVRILLANTAILFAVGCVLGATVAAILGFFAPPAGVRTRDVLLALARGAFWLLPASAAGLVLAGWIAMGSLAPHAGSVALLAATAACGLVGVAIVALAFQCAATCVANFRLRHARPTAR